jgi:hypothetical protein
MAADYEHSWGHWYALERLLVKPFVETDELGYESHVRVCHWPPLLQVIIPLLVVELLAVDEVGEADGGTAGDALDAVHVHLALPLPRLLDEVHRVVEHAFYVFSDVIFEMILFVGKFWLEIAG